MITADNITDEQITQVGLDARARLDAAREELDAALIAMTFHPLDGPSDWKRRAKARARCAEILNARKDGAK